MFIYWQRLFHNYYVFKNHKTSNCKTLALKYMYITKKEICFKNFKSIPDVVCSIKSNLLKEEK